MAIDEAAVQRLLDKDAIREALLAYTRGSDRRDNEIQQHAYHPDGVDDHGNYIGNAQGFIEYNTRNLEKLFTAHQHHMTNQVIELDGDVAHAETYVFFTFQQKADGKRGLMSGRYIDRLERRDGEWRIAVRQATIEWRCGPESTHVSPAPDQYPEGTWDKSDLSYLRPLELPAEVMRRRRT
jgi:ketosteroid isomerase-like protein